jgi:hypothetical protein
MPLPLGVANPLFLYELALELKMTVGELCHGRGTPMSLHELCVGWPAFFAYRRRAAEAEAAKPGRGS